MLISKIKKGFTLIELLVVITIISILAIWSYQIYDNQKAKARDSARVTAMSDLKWALETFTIQWYMSPPLNQHYLVAHWAMTTLPVDPDTAKLYQYNVDLRWYTVEHPKQAWANWKFLLATNTMVSSEWTKYIDIDTSQIPDTWNITSYTASWTDIKNLTHYNWYIIMWAWDANLLSDSWNSNYVSQNKHTKMNGNTSLDKCSNEILTLQSWYNPDLTKNSNSSDKQKAIAFSNSTNAKWGACLISLIWTPWGIISDVTKWYWPFENDFITKFK